jgi:hypothetical protein
MGTQKGRSGVDPGRSGGPAGVAAGETHRECPRRPDRGHCRRPQSGAARVDGATRCPPVPVCAHVLSFVPTHIWSISSSLFKPGTNSRAPSRLRAGRQPSRRRNRSASGHVGYPSHQQIGVRNHDDVIPIGPKTVSCRNPAGGIRRALAGLVGFGGRPGAASSHSGPLRLALALLSADVDRRARRPG